MSNDMKNEAMFVNITMHFQVAIKLFCYSSFNCDLQLIVLFCFNALF